MEQAAFAVVEFVAHSVTGARLALEPPVPAEEPAKALRVRIALLLGRGPKQISLFDRSRAPLRDEQLLREVLDLEESPEPVISYIVGAEDALFQAHILRTRPAPRTGELPFYTIGRCEFPEPQGIQIEMMPFLWGDKQSLPLEYQHYWPLIEQASRLLFDVKRNSSSVVYLTINEGMVLAGETQRRPGLHIEAPGYLSLDSKHNFVPGRNPARYGGGDNEYYDRHYLRNGIVMASSLGGTCRVWDAKIHEPQEVVGPMGDAEHLRLLLGEGRALEAGEMVWFTDSTPHEAMPCDESAYRQFFRLITPSLSVWYARHSTPNRLGVRPDPSLTRCTAVDKFSAPAGHAPCEGSYAKVMGELAGQPHADEAQAELQLLQANLRAERQAYQRRQDSAPSPRTALLSQVSDVLRFSQLKQDGISPDKLLQAGVPAKELQAAGCSAEECFEAGIPAAAIQEAGWSKRALKRAGYDVSELRKAE